MMIDNKKKHGFTFVEVCMVVIILSLVFGVASGVMFYARRETEKGRWMVQGIIQLRNTTRQIGIKMKQMSYPSTLLSNSNISDPTKTVQSVISFKEWREYDRSGRLRFMEVNNTKRKYEIHAAKNGGLIKPTGNDKVLMYFPVCTSEKDYTTGYTAGKIIWTRFVLAPSINFQHNKLGTILMEEYEAEYDTRGETRRAFDLNKDKYKGFDDPAKKLLRRKELITDVSGVEIKTFDMSSSRGFAVSASGALSDDFKKVKNIVTFKIHCSHPKDEKTKISDMCSITAGAEVEAL